MRNPFLFCTGLAALLIAGCAMPAATIGVLEFEREMLNQDAEAVHAHFQVKRELVEAQVESLWIAAEADIEAHQPPDPAWTITTIRGARAAAGLLEEKILVMMEARGVALDNITARQEALDRAAGLVEKSQNWPQDAKLWAAELRDLLEKSRAAP